jgi:hypothetical protein
MPTSLPSSRHQPCVPVLRGDFETHVTVRCDAESLARLDRWAAAAALKVTHIVLARGRMTSQPMLTYTAAGTLEEQLEKANDRVAALAAAGFDPVRVKIEASPWTDGVPVDDAQAQQHDPYRYFEHHAKIRLAPGTDLGALAARVAPHGAHLSWNARRTLGAGRHERFVTQRCHLVGVHSAGRRLQALVASLTASEVQIVSLEREFVVYDSDMTIDDGWITEEAGTR